MLLKDGENSHYCLINNMSALLASQINKHKGTRNICLNCLNSFKCKQSLDKHKEYCYNNEFIKTIIPEPGTYLRFKNFVHSEKVPFIIYADLESIVKRMDNYNSDYDPNKSYTKKYQKHEPISFSYYIKCFNESVYESRLRTYTGKDAMDVFIKWLEEDVKAIANIKPKEMIFTEEDKKQFIKSSDCWICKEPFKGNKVRDHCHYTGRYRGPACNSCNLKYRKPKFIPVVFHNLSGYDSHLFIKNLASPDEKENIDCIPNNEEKYISFSKTIKVGTYLDKKTAQHKDKTFKIRFIDSLKFMASSLEALVDNLPKDAFNNLDKFCTKEEAELIKRKGFYPYEYMDTEDKLNDTKLPPIEAFYSSLTGRGIKKEDYKHALNVWNTFKMKLLKNIMSFIMRQISYY